MLGKDVDMPHVSNSYFSARALVNYPERRKQLPPTDHYKQRFLDATSRARIKVATSARWRGLRISQQLMHTGELRRLVVLLHAREQAPRRQDVQGLFAATACVEINQTQVARLKFDFTQAAAPLLPRERGPPAAAVLQHPRGQAPPVALGDDDGALEGQGQKNSHQRGDLPRDARIRR